MNLLISTKHDGNAFRDFVNCKLDSISRYSSKDDLLEFAFADFESAVEAFEKATGRKHQTNKEYLDDEHFFGVVSDEYDDVSVVSRDGEIAEWAFGDVEDALKNKPLQQRLAY